jgi:hypothetical protein
MSRVLVAVDPSVGVDPAGFVAAWGEVPEAAQAGPARVESVAPGQFVPGVAELIWVPLAVNLVSSAVYDVVRRVVQRARRGREVSEVEIVEFTSAGGDRVVVARARREVS